MRLTEILNELPLQSSDKNGWPWTEQTLVSTYSSIIDFPKISVVIPSYNQGVFIEETIRSVLLQNYPNTELIIIDGGSTDNTIEIIKKYKKWITYWVSEKDKGQSDAINKGWLKSTGIWLGWQNSDDIYLKNAFFEIAKLVLSNKNYQILSGNVLTIDQYSNLLSKSKFIRPTLSRVLHEGFVLSSQGVFWRNDIRNKIGLLNLNLHHAMDMDLYIKILKNGTAGFTKQYLGAFRIHSNTKTSQKGDIGTSEFLSLIKSEGIKVGTLKYIVKKKYYKIARLIKHYLY